jgi:N-acetyl-anhydromuramyl-L-alanine amidase AmpD
MHFDDLGWLDIAKEYNISANSWNRNMQATHLVVHGTAGGSNGDDTLAYELSVGVSTHFAISTNGDIWQGVPCNFAAWGNAPLKSPLIDFVRADANPNLWTISIEFCKPDVTNEINITDAQKASGFALIAAICEHYNIPKRRGDSSGGIIRHADINSIDRAMCPGTFPFDELWTYLEGATMALDISQVKDYFTEIGSTPDTRWRCKQTNQDIAYGVLTYYRSCTQVGLNGFSQYGLPISGEEKVPNTKQAVLQRFERGVILYDALHEVDSVPGLTGPCYPAHIDKGLGQDPQVAQLEAQIATLQKQPAAPANVTSAVNTLQTLQITLQASANAAGKIITDLKG